MRQALRIIVFALPLLAFRPQPAFAQSYGLGQQVLVIGPTEFHPLQSTVAYSTGFPDGYVFAGGGEFHAPLHLPDGALITMMCYYAYDPDGGGSSAQIDAVKLPAGGQPSGYVLISSVSESFNIGFGTVCTNPLSYTFHDEADLDGMGVAHLAHEVYTSGSTNTGFGGVRIFWQRQVSPAPVSPTFGDVPTDGFGYAQIEALVAAGITGGCGGGNYCPNANVTRAQMAIFLAKALGLHWAN